MVWQRMGEKLPHPVTIAQAAKQIGHKQVDLAV
jgi:hypothetical protein